MEGFELLVIQTGGTIDKDYPKRQGGYAFELHASGALTVLRRVMPSFPFRLLTPCLQDSQDLTNQHRQQILRTCQEAEEKFILITHGTDTILQTAAFLATHPSPLPPPSDHSSPPPRHADPSQTPGPDPVDPSTAGLPSQSVWRTTGKVLVLTGAFLPERFKDTDADFNVGVAVGAMQGGLLPGVYVALGGRVWRWDRVTRSDSGQFVGTE